MKPTEEQIQKLLEYLTQAIEFGKEQMPLLAEEMVRYGVFYHSMLLCVFAGVVLAGAILLRMGVKTPPDRNDCWSDTKGFLTLGGASVLGAGLIGIIPNAMWLGMVLISPRFYLLKELKALL